MPNINNYDMDFRPDSYWDITGNESQFGAAIKGELRRNVARQLAEDEILDPVVSVESLSDEQIGAAGSVHPWFLGGEYLPDLLPHEVEIARATLQSTTLDVISIRARRTKHRIKYRIVDEYSDDPIYDYPLVQQTSIKPLTLHQLIRIIDNAQERGLDGEARFYNYTIGDSAPEEIYDFASISSDFYPELRQWYDEANREWLEEELKQLEDDEEFEEDEF